MDILIGPLKDSAGFYQRHCFRIGILGAYNIKFFAYTRTVSTMRRRKTVPGAKFHFAPGGTMKRSGLVPAQLALWDFM